MIKPSKEFIELFKKTPGALSVTEAIALYNIHKSNGGYSVLELGTHKGKSSLVFACDMDYKKYVLHLVEPEFKDREWSRWVADNIRAINPMLRMYMIDDYSTNVIPTQTGDFHFVFVDSGSHQDGLPMEEAKLLEDRIVPGGVIAWHDFDSQFKEVREAYNYLLSTGKYEEMPINWQEIVDYVNAENLEEGNESWHHAELRNPCFVGALKRK